MQGLLLVQIGTPEGPDPQSVGRYLREFLMDPDVIDIPFLARWFLVHALIVPKRKFTSAESYQKIWTTQGSPLRVYSDQLREQVQKNLGSTWDVQVAMRYGQPTIRRQLERWKKMGIESGVVLPLYPQYSLAATESSLRLFEKEIRRLYPQNASAFSGPKAPWKLIREFYQESFFIQPWVKQLQARLAAQKWDAVLFSYHGLPERQIRKTPGYHPPCLDEGNCCENKACFTACYRAQALATTRAIVQAADLGGTPVFSTFQSRLGRTVWVKPYTDEWIEQAPARGYKKVLVLCPSFTIDCLETLEEIGFREKEKFLKCGGEQLELLPCPNADAAWAEGLASWVKGQ